jgi:hypothetical protein
MIDDKEVKKQNAIDKDKEPQSHAPKVEGELSESDLEQIAGGEDIQKHVGS